MCVRHLSAALGSSRYDFNRRRYETQSLGSQGDLAVGSWFVCDGVRRLRPEWPFVFGRDLWRVTLRLGVDGNRCATEGREQSRVLRQMKYFLNSTTTITAVWLQCNFVLFLFEVFIWIRQNTTLNYVHCIYCLALWCVNKLTVARVSWCGRRKQTCRWILCIAGCWNCRRLGTWIDNFAGWDTFNLCACVRRVDSFHWHIVTGL